MVTKLNLCDQRQCAFEVGSIIQIKTAFCASQTTSPGVQDGFDQHGIVVKM